MVSDLCDHLNLAQQRLCQPSIVVEIPRQDAVLGMGFISDLSVVQPTHRQLVFDAGESGHGISTVLYTGIPPPSFRVNARNCTVFIGTPLSHTAQCIGTDVLANEEELENLTKEEAAKHEQVKRLRQAQREVFFSVLSRLESLSSSLQTAVVARRPKAAQAVATLRELVSYLRSNYEKPSFNVQSTLQTSSAENRCQIARLRKRAVTTMERILNELSNLADAIRMEASVIQTRAGSADTGQTSHSWLRCISQQVFAKDILQRLRRQAEKAGIDSTKILDIVPHLLSHFSQSPIVASEETSLSPRVSTLVKTNLAVARRLLKPGNAFAQTATAVDLLYMVSMVGTTIQVPDNNNAAAINPWQLRLESVGRDPTVQEDGIDLLPDTASMLCGLHATSKPETNAEKSRVSNKKKSSSFVLALAGIRNNGAKPFDADHAVVSHFVRSRLYHRYLGIIFARHPEVMLPGQQSALLFVSFAKLCEQLLLPIRNADRAEILRARDVDSLISVWGAIRDHCCRSIDQWNSRIETLVTATDPAVHLTEGGADVQSVCQVLVPLTCLPCPDTADGSENSNPNASLHSLIYPKSFLFGKPGEHAADGPGRIAKVALSIMGEAVSRACRRLVGKDPTKMWILLKKALGIKDHQCQDTLPDDQVEPPAAEIDHRGDWDIKVKLCACLVTNMLA